MNSLEHILVEICYEEDRVGGIYPEALANRAAAQLAHEGTPPPDDLAIKQVIFELLSDKALYLTDNNKLKATTMRPVATLARNAPDPGEGLRNPSGFWPIGGGDYLYNLAGDAVCRIAKISVPPATKEVDLTLEIMFETVVPYQFHGKGTVLGANKQQGRPLAPPGKRDASPFCRCGKDDRCPVHQNYRGGANKNTVK